MANSITSAQVILFVNGTAIGRVSDFEWSSTTNHTPIHVVDQSQPMELAPTTTEIQGTLTVYRTLGDGGAEGMGVTTQFQDTMRQKYSDLSLVERSTGLTLFHCEYTQFNTQSWGVSIKGILTGHLSFVGITWTNEIPPAKR